MNQAIQSVLPLLQKGLRWGQISLQRILLGLIAAYRYLISPWLGRNCRFTPSCSEYTQEAIQVHGAAYGSYLGLKRVVRCAPWSQGGYDPVPGKNSAQTTHGVGCTCPTKPSITDSSDLQK